MNLFQKLKTATNQALDSGKRVYKLSPISSLAKKRKDALSSAKVKKAKELAIRFFSRIDYDIVIKQLGKFRYLDPRLAIAVLVIEKIKVAFDHYNHSKLQNREIKLSEQLSKIGKEFKLIEVIDIIAPFSKKIPYGKAIMLGLRLMSNIPFKKEKGMTS